MDGKVILSVILAGAAVLIEAILGGLNKDD